MLSAELQSTYNIARMTTPPMFHSIEHVEQMHKKKKKKKKKELVEIMSSRY
jgi:hypothetical protein